MNPGWGIDYYMLILLLGIAFIFMLSTFYCWRSWNSDVEVRNMINRDMHLVYYTDAANVAVPMEMSLISETETVL
jgi:hypothetical protein